MYGISAEYYGELSKSQHGLCAICGKPESAHRHGKVIGLNVDHDHETGKVRGLLCSRCNMAVGLLGDSVENLLAAAMYLERSKK